METDEKKNNERTNKQNQHEETEYVDTSDIGTLDDPFILTLCTKKKNYLFIHFKIDGKTQTQ